MQPPGRVVYGQDVRDAVPVQLHGVLRVAVVAHVQPRQHLPGRKHPV